MTFPTLRQVVLDATDVRALAEFYRQLLGFVYRAGDEPPAVRDWLVLEHPSGAPLIAFQEVPALRRSTWPDNDVPQQLHLDFSVPDRDELERQHQCALELGASVLQDRADDPREPIRVYADPAGHPFCIFVGA